MTLLKCYLARAENGHVPTFYSLLGLCHSLTVTVWTVCRHRMHDVGEQLLERYRIMLRGLSCHEEISVMSASSWSECLKLQAILRTLKKFIPKLMLTGFKLVLLFWRQGRGKFAVIHSKKGCSTMLEHMLCQWKWPGFSHRGLRLQRAQMGSVGNHLSLNPWAHCPSERKLLTWMFQRFDST